MKQSKYKSYDDLPRVVANSVSLASPQTARLTHYVAPPFSTQALRACVGTPLKAKNDQQATEHMKEGDSQ